jgi:hypothetical protein
MSSPFRHQLLLLFAFAIGWITSCTSAVAPSSATPTVTAITPTAGSIQGGTVVTITGTNFSGPGTVTLGGTAAVDVTVRSSTTITATTGPHVFDRVDVVVTVGGNSLSLPQGYLYFDPDPQATLP